MKDRRCFALYHRLMPYEPIIFIEVALTRGIPRSMGEIMADPEDRTGETRADTAVLSTPSTIPRMGLWGLGMGKMLIGKVVAYLKDENKKLQEFYHLESCTRFLEAISETHTEGRRRRVFS